MDIKELLAKGKTKAAIEALFVAAKNSKDNDFENGVIALKSKFSSLRKDIRNGTISSETENLEKNRITANILSFVDEYGPFDTEDNPTLDSEQVMEMEKDDATGRIEKLMNKRKFFQDELDIAVDPEMKFYLNEKIEVLTRNIELLKSKLS